LKRILSINPGSTSTKIGIFEDENLLIAEKIVHSVEELEQFDRIVDQKEKRKADIIEFLDKNGYTIEMFDAFAARGGILPALESGTYEINEHMVKYLTELTKVEHASNLAAVIAYGFAADSGKKAYITDPVSVDEFEDMARFSGIKEIDRKSLFHALNMKSVARKVADEIGKEYSECNFVIAHLGGGISIGAQKAGKMIDVNNANDEGPFSPERSGGLPAGDVVKMAFSGEYTKKELKTLFTRKAGLTAYLNTNDLLEAFSRGENDPKAMEVIEAMAYQIGKEIGAMCVVLKGEIDGIILTGGMSNNIRFVEMIKGYVSSFGLVAVVPGENELEALATGTLRVLNGKEIFRTFSFEGGEKNA